MLTGFAAAKMPPDRERYTRPYCLNAYLMLPPSRCSTDNVAADGDVGRPERML